MTDITTPKLHTNNSRKRHRKKDNTKISPNNASIKEAVEENKKAEQGYNSKELLPFPVVNMCVCVLVTFRVPKVCSVVRLSVCAWCDSPGWSDPVMV